MHTIEEKLKINKVKAVFKKQKCEQCNSIYEVSLTINYDKTQDNKLSNIWLCYYCKYFQDYT
jgi:hypothetical protein